jgi:hypothetical protein
MAFCESCLWWGRGRDIFGGLYALESTGGKVCGNNKLSDNYDPDTRIAQNDLVIGQTEFALPIITGPLFGCVHYSAKRAS